MRALACLLALALLAVAAVSPAEAKPLLPQTRQAVREMAHDTLQDADHTSAQLLREARAMVREARKDAERVAVPTVPVPALPQNSPLEVRAMMTQPGFQGQDDILAVTWIGAKSGTWTGAYWLESDDGMILPNVLEVNEDGMLLIMYGGSLSLDGSIDGARYRFLGIDGGLVTRAIPPIPLLPDVPTLDRVSLAGADASARGKAPEALIVAPWNTLARNVTMGLTLLADGATREDFAIAGCDDPLATETEAGCRLIYVLELAPDVTDLELWHIAPDGSRVVDATHDRLSLELGVRFAG